MRIPTPSSASQLDGGQFDGWSRVRGGGAGRLTASPSRETAMLSLEGGLAESREYARSVVTHHASR